jgi:hypothetical protein
MTPSSLRLKSKKDSELSQNTPKSLRLKESEFPFEGENDLEREIERNIAQQTSRQLESVGGSFGNINSIIEGFTGLPLIGGVLGHLAPTSKKLREKSEEYSRGYTTPKNDFEEKIGEFQQDIADFALPGSKQYSFARNIGIPLLSNLAKEGVKKLGGSESSSSAARMGLMTILDIISQRKGGAKKYVSGLFEDMGKRVPEGLSYNAQGLEEALKESQKIMQLGGKKPSTVSALGKIGEILSSVKNGKINLKEAIAFRPAINEMIDDLGGFEYLFKPKLKKKIINNLQKVKSEVIKSIEDYGRKFDPEFLKLSQTANEANAALEKSNKISSFLNKNFGTKALSKPLQILLGIGGPGLGALKVGAGATTAIGIPLATAYQGVKMFSRLKNSPTLRKYYLSIVDAAAKGNVAQAARAIKAAEKELDEDQE